jgi:hypothetical protein
MRNSTTRAGPHRSAKTSRGGSREVVKKSGKAEKRLKTVGVSFQPP